VKQIPTIVLEQRRLVREGMVSLLENSNFKVIASVATLDELSQVALGRAGLVVFGAPDRWCESCDWLKRICAAPRAYKVAVVAEAPDQIVLPGISNLMRCAVDALILNIRSREVLLTSLDLAVLEQKVLVMPNTRTPHLATRTG
jgi:hypothetical protein